MWCRMRPSTHGGKSSASRSAACRIVPQASLLRHRVAYAHAASKHRPVRASGGKHAFSNCTCIFCRAKWRRPIAMAAFDLARREAGVAHGQCLPEGVLRILARRAGGDEGHAMPIASRALCRGVCARGSSGGLRKWGHAPPRHKLSHQNGCGQIEPDSLDRASPISLDSVERQARLWSNRTPHAARIGRNSVPAQSCGAGIFNTRSLANTLEHTQTRGLPCACCRRVESGGLNIATGGGVKRILRIGSPFHGPSSANPHGGSAHGQKRRRPKARLLVQLAARCGDPQIGARSALNEAENPNVVSRRPPRGSSLGPSPPATDGAVKRMGKRRQRVPRLSKQDSLRAPLRRIIFRQRA